MKKKSRTLRKTFFNRSEIVFEEDGQEKTFHVLYVRFFDESMNEFTPYEQDPVFIAGSREVQFKDLVALSCLLKNPGFRHRKRIYLNSKADFASYFQDLDFSKLPSIFEALENKKSFDLRSPLDFIVQPQ
ncbi:hypothetical protein HMPREF1013_02147 [Bacillus sp. 2_A_57_CT2]|nr:hypothetical protein HMPREF1013_02147 [Bacillus sp. 2_A_57_CT2]